MANQTIHQEKRSLAEAFYLEEEVNGEALIAIHHDELKEIGIASLGHRLTILKGVYDIKVKQNVPVEPEHYVPLCSYPMAVKSCFLLILISNSRGRECS